MEGVRAGGARMHCKRCGYIWVRQVRPSRGQIIRCPRCRVTLGTKSTPIKIMSVKDYIGSKGMDEYGMAKSKK